MLNNSLKLPTFLKKSRQKTSNLFLIFCSAKDEKFDHSLFLAKQVIRNKIKFSCLLLLLKEVSSWLFSYKEIEYTVI